MDSTVSEKHEKKAIEEFRRYLRDAGEGEWDVDRFEVPVGNGRNFDCELRCLGRASKPIALEVTRLVPIDDHLDADARDKSVEEYIRPALQNDGCTGFEIQRFLRDENIRQGARQLVNEILKARPNNPRAEEIVTDGAHLHRRDYLKGVNSIHGHRHRQMSTGPEWSRVRPALLQALKRKRSQLPTSGYRCVLLTVSDSGFVSTEAVIEACSLIPFEEYPEFDQIYFADHCGRVNLVFDQQILLSWRGKRFPEDPRLERCFSWFTLHRLNYVGQVLRFPARQLDSFERHAIEIVLKLSTERGGIDWLPENPGFVLGALQDRLLRDSAIHTPHHCCRL